MASTPLAVEHRLAARADLLRLLAACFYEPDPAFVEEGVLDALAEAALQVDAAVGRHALRAGAAFDAASPQELLVDYARLFMGPPAPLARPYAGPWLGEPDVLDRVTAWYEEGGFDVSDDFRDRPDHIAVELEFLYLLLFNEARARHQGEGGEADASSVVRERFVATHLAAWVGPFAAAVAASAQTAFYRELAALLAAFIAWESGRYTSRG